MKDKKLSVLFCTEWIYVSYERCLIMKKTKHSNASVKKQNVIKSDEKGSETGTDASRSIDPLDDENQGFGGWLRSDDGMETMKLFIIANSIVLMTTLVYPHLRTAVEILGEMVYGVEEDF
ncbi:hypothetical protein NE865_05305 [Phthorimaea operculella]|nr:hypothetical protein NE865_05305 [Phthorimaea operculella]